MVEHILKHELLHILIRPRQIDGRMAVHPPEFWAEEKRISPSRDEVWDWLHIALIAHLKIDEKREAAMIRRGWHRPAAIPFPTLEYARGLAKSDLKALGYI